LAVGASCQANLNTNFFVVGNQTITIELTYFDGAANQTVTEILPVLVTF